ncbi:MAG: tetratricopeptide repeat protein [Candidatus Desulfofervidaceae bacterium]|nr:tetratricopeptide repeat protein [Candidatus Desulfofervidaceae bacterium]
MSLIEEALNKKKEEKNAQAVDFKDTVPSVSAFTPFPKRRNYLRILIISLGACFTVGLAIFAFNKWHTYKVATTNHKIGLPQTGKRASSAVPEKKQLPYKDQVQKTEVKLKRDTKISNSKPVTEYVVPPPAKLESKSIKTHKLESEHYYSVQLGSFRNLEGAKRLFRHVFCPQGRIEKIGTYYAVRCGLYREKKEAMALKQELLKRGMKGIYVTFVKYLPDRVVYKINGNALKPKKATAIPKIRKTQVVKKPSISPEEVSSLLKQAYNHLRSNNLGAALKIYNQILAAFPHQTEALINRGIVWQRIGAFQKAEDDLLHALKLSPDDPVILNALGVNYLKQKRYKEAREYFQKANNATSMINMAILAWETGDLSQVPLYLNKAALIAPRNPYVHYYLGLFYKKQQDLAKAEKEFGLCQKLAEERGDFYLLQKLQGR